MHNAYESDADMSFFSLSPAQYYPVYTQSSSNSSSDSSIDDHASDDSIPTNNGRVTLVSREAAEAVIAYIPNPDFFGADIILYSVCDSTAAANVDDQNAIISNDTGWCVNGSISVTVIPVNDAPLAEISAQVHVRINIT